ncbi:MAG: 7-carboxy-7-deazaguanine synthase QueE [Burkholderiales bacterium]|nr:7-carboxy-7-deazaguanine synthase QueE [Burkholderiales bacterium]
MNPTTTEQPAPVVTDAAAAATLRVTEIFFSLQGETSRVGLPTVFVRLTGCPLRCGYCDTAYAFHGGESMALDMILERVAAYGARQVTLTGGEPLAQKHAPLLLRQLADAGYSVSLETSGALDVSGVDVRISKILDLKTPGSGESARNLWANLAHLTPQDEIKFVLCDEQDYDWARQQLQQRKLAAICPVLFSPVHDRLEPRRLAEWILRDRLPVRLQLQLHKLLWGEVPGH